MKALVYLFCGMAVFATTVLGSGLKYGREYTVVEYGSNICEGVQIHTGSNPLPTNSVTSGAYANRNVTPMYLEVVAGTIVQKSTEEKATVDATVAAAKVAWDAAQAQAMAAAVVDWNDSKTNHAVIAQWENRFMLRLGQLNGILTAEGIITNDITPQTIDPSVLATYIITATNTSASSVGIAFQEADAWNTKITVDNVGAPPDGKVVSYYVEQH